jgi:hypothetical protein
VSSTATSAIGSTNRLGPYGQIAIERPEHPGQGFVVVVIRRLRDARQAVRRGDDVAAAAAGRLLDDKAAAVADTHKRMQRGKFECYAGISHRDFSLHVWW